MEQMSYRSITQTLANSDIETIRAVRRLCLQHEFEQAIEMAKNINDNHTRNTLVLICKSFKTAQITVRDPQRQASL